MKIVSCDKLDQVYAGETTIPAGARAVVPDWTLRGLIESCRRQNEHPRVSGMGHYRRPYFGHNLDGKRLLMWRGCGIGDQLVWAGLAAILKDRFPRAEIVNYCYPLHCRELWAGAAPGSLSFEPREEPIPFEDWRDFDYHLVGEDLCEADQERDQPDIWTGHLLAAGLDPKTVPAEQCRPLVSIRTEDVRGAAHWLGSRGLRTDPWGHLAGGRPLILWQLAASSPIRSWRPDLSLAALTLLCRDLPGAVVAVTGRTEDLGAYPLPEADNLWCATGLPIRTVFALADTAACIVAPDSCLGHAAAALGRPCVSLWGSFLPGDRVGTYPTHRPLVGRTACSPCRTHEKSAATQGCPRCQSGERTVPYCEALAQIDPEAVVRQVKEIVQCPL
jgi:hypothetical protein